LEYSALLTWLAIRYQPVFSSIIVVNKQLFSDLSSTIALKDRGFVSVSSSLNDWTVEMKDEDGSVSSVSSVSWILLYRASLSGYEAAYFIMLAMEWKSVLLLLRLRMGELQLPSTRMALLLFLLFFKVLLLTSMDLLSLSTKCGDIFHQNEQECGIWNTPSYGPDFGDLCSSDLFFVKINFLKKLSLLCSPLIRSINPLDISLRYINSPQFNLVRLHLKPRSNLLQLHILAPSFLKYVVSKRDEITLVGKRQDSFRVFFRDGEEVL
jgi:hypothetical protein